MTREDPGMLRGLLHSDTDGEEFREFAARFGAGAEVEVLVEPAYPQSTVGTGLTDVQLEHWLDGSIIAHLERYVWLRMSVRRLERLQTEESMQTLFAQYGIRRIWPNLPLIPQRAAWHELLGARFTQPLAAIGSPEPREDDGSGIRWAVIDTDVRDSHMFFEGRVIRKEVLPDRVQDARPFQHVSGHGTHIAGIIHAVAPAAEIVSLALPCELSVHNDERSTIFAESLGHLERALDWIAGGDNGIHGVNISLGTRLLANDTLVGQGPGCTGVDACVAAGKVVVVAAGNYGANQDRFQEISITDPANARGALSVGACYDEDPDTQGVWAFSSRGPTADGREKPDLVAPGVKISSCSARGNTETREDSGTSQAAAYVSGVCAALMSRASKQLTPEDVVDVLKTSARNLKRAKTSQGAGLVDLDGATRKLGKLKWAKQ